MEADIYLAEHIIRDRRAEAQARAELARLFAEASRSSEGAGGGFWHRLVERGRSLVNRRGRKAADARRPLEGGTLA